MNDDLISRAAAIDAVMDEFKRLLTSAIRAKTRIEALPPAEPDNRLTKIANLMDGTIDHFDLDDAMDLLYQIKGVLKNG